MATARETLPAYYAWKQRHRKLGDSSLVKYRPILAAFSDWAADRDLETIDQAAIDFEFLSLWTARFEEKNKRPPAQNTMRLVYTILSSYFDYLQRVGRVRVNPMMALDRPQYVPKRDWLEDSERDAILAAVKSPQERIVIYLLMWSGLRIGEAIALKNKDVDTAAGVITVPVSKTRAGLRRIPIIPELLPELIDWKHYQTKRGLHEDETPFLATSSGRPMHDYYIWKVVKRVANHAGVRVLDSETSSMNNLSEISPHTLRRSFGHFLLNRGVDIEAVSSVLGHENVRITQQAYAQLLNETVARRIMAAFDGDELAARRSRRR